MLNTSDKMIPLPKECPCCGAEVKLEIGLCFAIIKCKCGLIMFGEIDKGVALVRKWNKRV